MAIQTIIINHFKLRKVMARKHHDEASCVRSLSKKNSICIIGNCIEVLRDATDVGNGSYGKIDFLTKQCGYVCIFVTKLKSKASRMLNTKEDGDNTPITSKAAKRERKLNMATMAKTAMKRVKTK